jgi:hypothetical protein
MTGLRWRAAILSTLLLAASKGIAQQEAPAPVADLSSSHETFDYAVEWRLISAGTAKLNWTPLPPNSAAASEVKLHLESTGLVSRLFRVSDDYTSMLGANFCGQNTFMSAHEGSRIRETRVVYDQPARKARYTERDLVKNSTNTNEVDIPPCAHDVLGGLMLLRTLHPEPGKTVQIPVSDGKKTAQVRVESQRREEITTPMGVKKTIRYEIFVFDNILYKRSGHLHVWLTDDSERLPVQLQVHLQFTIGTITFRMQKEARS